MTHDQEIIQAVEKARQLLSDHGHDCTTTAEDLVCWFRADTPYDVDLALDEILGDTLIVIHELVEIENVKRMGLSLTKGVITDNLEKVDDAHLIATEVELRIAASTGNVKHIQDRLDNIRMWSEDPSVTPENRERYRKMHSETLKVIESLT